MRACSSSVKEEMKVAKDDDGSTAAKAEVGEVRTSARGKQRRVLYAQAEARLLAVKEVVQEMIKAVREQK